MKKIWISIQKSLNRTTSSIAFIPTLFAISGLLLSFLTITIEYKPLIIDFKQKIDFLLITDQEEGRLVLGTLVGSLISLMVFSFSMVMVVLNRASSNLSPRVLPGLISNKSHQLVLGFYLATILYSLIMIINFQSDAEYTFPSLGILIAMCFGVTCLSLFIYFIHSISESIKVENILFGIFKRTALQIENNKPKDVHSQDKIPETHEWEEIALANPGYLKQIKVTDLLQLANKYDFQLLIQKHIGAFIVEGYPYIKIKHKEKLSNKVIDDIETCFSFYPDDQVKDHYLFGFKQISEIAVKALSPGINDPGTATKALDFLSVLFINRMKIKEPLYEEDESGKVKIVYSPVSLRELIFQNLVPIREYGKTDTLVMFKLLEVLKNMLFADRKEMEYSETLVRMVESCIQSAESAIQNSLDRAQLNVLIGKMNELMVDKQRFSFLTLR